MKNKVIIVHPDRGARIHVTDDPSKFTCSDNEVMLVNPSTVMVDGLPPEMWKVVDGKLVGITEEHEVARRMMSVQTLPNIMKAVEAHDLDLNEAVLAIHHIDHNVAMLSGEFDIISEKIESSKNEIISRIAQTYLEIKHQRYLLVAIIILQILGGVSLWLISRA